MNDLDAKVEALRAAVGKMTPGPAVVNGLGGIKMDGIRDSYSLDRSDGGKTGEWHGPYIARMHAGDRLQRRHDAEALCALRNDALALIDALQARIAEVERDAARYRWLRDMSEPHVGKFYISVNEEHKDVKFDKESVDAEIDSCIGILRDLTERPS